MKLRLFYLEISLSSLFFYFERIMLEIKNRKNCFLTEPPSGDTDKVRKGVFPNIRIWFLNFTFYFLWNAHIFQALRSLLSILLTSINMKVYLLWRPEEMKQQFRYICKDTLFLVPEMLGRSIFVFHSKEDFWFFWGKMLLLVTNIKRIFFGMCTEPKLLPDVSKVTILQWWDWS